MLERLVTCPLGHHCESVRDNKIEICAWLMDVKGVDPQTGEQVDKQVCAVVAQTMMLMDNTKAMFGVANSQATLSQVLTDNTKALSSATNRPAMLCKGQ